MNDKAGSYLKRSANGVWLAAAIALGGCATQEASPPSTAMSSGAALRMASDAAAAWNSHNIQEISKGYTNGATFSGPFMTGPVPAQAMFESLRELFVAVPDARIKVVSAAPAGENMIAEQWVIAGTWTAPFAGGILAGMAPTGKTFILPGASFLHVQGDKIVSEIQYYDQLMYIAQLGILQKP